MRVATDYGEFRNGFEGCIFRNRSIYPTRAGLLDEDSAPAMDRGDEATIFSGCSTCEPAEQRGRCSVRRVDAEPRVDELKAKVADAWPNSFRQARFLSAVDFVQSDRLRRMVAMEMARIFSQVDLLLVPSLRDEMLTITNFTGHPSLTMRAGFVEVTQARSDWAPDPEHPLPRFDPPRRVPHGVTLIGRLFDEGTLGRVGLALERAFGVAEEHPPDF